MSLPRIAVIGAGAFGQNHCRVVHESPRASLSAIVDTNAARASETATRYQATAFTDARELAGQVDAAIVAAPLHPTPKSPARSSKLASTS